jgi:phosphoglycerol transferase MdoB-like AlkP superfamily enzyme
MFEESPEEFKERIKRIEAAENARTGFITSGVLTVILIILLFSGETGHIFGVLGGLLLYVGVFYLLSKGASAIFSGPIIFLFLACGFFFLGFLLEGGWWLIWILSILALAIMSCIVYRQSL